MFPNKKDSRNGEIPHIEHIQAAGNWYGVDAGAVMVAVNWRNKMI